MSPLGGGRVARRRLYEVPDGAVAAPSLDERAGFLRRWLYLAGIRRPWAPAAFVFATIGAIVFALLASFAITRSVGFASLMAQLRGGPGEIAEVFPPLFTAMMWIGPALVFGLAPLLIVRARRRRLVQDVEHDLPITLELLATLAEAGLGFDGAVAHLLDATDFADRPFRRELRTFQLEALAGMPRVRCFRRLAARIDVPSVNGFVSVLVQAEQIGTGVAQVLRQQANDIRDRRRQAAFARAQALSGKLAFPLVICFLPPLFVFALGPTLGSLFRLLDQYTWRAP